jgi:DivIVA domain-containing protein
LTSERTGMPPSREGETRSAYVVQRHFRLVRKGYDPAEVDRHLELVSEWFRTSRTAEKAREIERQLTGPRARHNGARGAGGPPTPEPLERPRGGGHLIAWVCLARREGCGVHAKDASPVCRGVPS